MTTTYGIRQVTPAFTSDTSTGTGTKYFSISPTRTGITIDSVTGVVTVESNTAVGTWIETITATDQVGAIGITTMTIVVNTGISISGGSNITITQGVSRSSAARIASNGTGTKVFSILPAVTGITIDSVTGVVTADSTTVAGTYVETITATDSVGATATQMMTVLVNGPLTIGGGVATFYTTFGLTRTTPAFTYGGGTTPWRFTISPTVTGITIDSITAIITVLGSTLKGTYLETVTVTDSLSVVATTQITIQVNDSITVSAGSDIATTRGIAMYSSQFAASGGTTGSNGGSGVLTFTLTPGYSGISIDTLTGIIFVDSNTVAGTYNESVTATDSFGVTGKKNVRIVVADTITVTAGGNIITTVGYQLKTPAFVASNGTGTKRFSIAPTVSGITIDSVTGIVTVDSFTAISDYVETITSTDSVGATGYKAMTIKVNIAPTIGGGSNILTTRLRSDTSTAFTVSGGTSIFRYSITPTVSGISIDSVTGIVKVETYTVANTYIETVTVTDSVGATSSTQMTIVVNTQMGISGGNNIVTTSGIGQVSSAFVGSGGTITGTGGTAVYKYTLVSNPTSSYITIDSVTGVITVDSAVAAADTLNARVYTETITVTDNLNMSYSITKTITVNAPILLTNGSNITTTQGVARSSNALVKTGGTTGVAYSIATANATPLPSGITINSTTGVVTVNSSTSSGTYTETITATDSVGATAKLGIIILVNDSITITAGSNILTTYGRADTATAFTSTGGTGTKNYQITSTIPSGVAINASTGVITVSKTTPVGIYTETVSVTDSVNATISTTMIIRVNDSITVANGSDITTSYGITRSSSAFTATGGTTAATGGAGVLVFSLVPVISGITIDQNGIVTVDSTVAGNQTYYETVTVTDSLTVIGTKTMSILVNTVLTLAAGSNIVTTTGVSRSSSVFAKAGGTTPWTFSITDTPTWFSVNSSGIVTVDSTTPSGIYYETVTVTDSVGATARQPITIRVNPAMVISGSTTIYNTTGRTDTRTTYTATGGTTSASGGVGNYSWSITGTQANAGILINSSTGLLTIKDTLTANTYLETITVTDSVSATTKYNITIIVNPAIQVNGGSNITTSFGITRTSTAFTATGGTTAASGGVGALVFSLVPTITGISIDQNGIVTVDSTVAGGQTYNETVTVSDSFTVTGTKPMTITVNTQLTLGTGSNIVTTAGVARSSSAFVYAGGTTPWTYTITDTPTWFSVSGTGVVTVSAITPANIYYETVTVTDSVGAVARSPITIRVNPAMVISGSTTIYNTTGRTDSSTTYTATGGTTSASGGAGSYSWSISGTQANAGILINASTGVLTIKDTLTATTYYETITVTDSVSATTKYNITIYVNAAIVVNGGDSITTTQGIAKSTRAFTATGGTITGSGGSSAYAFSLVSNPANSGIRIDSATGIVYVADTVTANTYYETITVTDNLGVTGYKTVTFLVNALNALTNGSDVVTTQGVAATSAAFGRTGGTTPWTYSVSNAAAGFTINSSGVVSVPNTVDANTYYETVTITDSVTAFGTKAITIRVNPVISITGPNTLYTTTGRIDTSTTETATGGTTPATGGTRAFIFALTSNPVASGITISQTGQIRVADTVTAGTYYETVTVTDSVGATATKNFTIYVAQSITVTGGGVINTTFGFAQTSAAFIANFGTDTKTFTLLNAPSGVSISGATGVITATSSTAVGVYIVTVVATDIYGMTGLVLDTITINAVETVTGTAAPTTTFDTVTVLTYTFNSGTGIKKVTSFGTAYTGISWDTSTANTAKLTVAQFMPLGTYTPTLTIVDSVGATITYPITLTAAKGNRSLTETSTSINIRYGDTATVSGIGYPNGTACQSVITTDGNYTVVQFKNTGACNWAVPNGVTSVQVLAVGGGGAGGHGRGGGMHDQWLRAGHRGGRHAVQLPYHRHRRLRG